jgi:hypothetical protein
MLNISELVKKHEDKREYWKKKYDKILEDCHKRIKYYAKYGHTECYFQIPKSKFGLPVYDTHECLHYIIMKLKRNGMDLEVLSNKIIHISWGRYLSDEPKYVQTAKQIREAEQLRLLPAPQNVVVPPPQSINRPAHQAETFSNKDYFNPAIKPVIQGNNSNRYMLEQDMIPQRNMSEPIMNLGPRPITTRTAEKIHKPNQSDNMPKRRYTRRSKTEESSRSEQNTRNTQQSQKPSSRIIFN